MLAQVSAFAFFAGLAAAVHAPVGDPKGNPISAPLNEIVPACKPFAITWEPTTPNTVSILLLRGPSENVVPLGAPIAEGIANSGTFSWTPASTLEADTTHYGIQLIDDVTGQYQYSTQFGISKDDCKDVTPSSSTKGGYGYATSTAESSSSSEISYPTSSANSTTVYPTSVSASSYIASTGYPAHNSIIQPTKSLSVPASLKTSATPATATPATPSSPATSTPAQATGAAAGLRAGLGLAGAVAGLVFVL